MWSVSRISEESKDVPNNLRDSCIPLKVSVCLKQITFCTSPSNSLFILILHTTTSTTFCVYNWVQMKQQQHPKGLSFYCPDSVCVLVFLWRYNNSVMKGVIQPEGSQTARSGLDTVCFLCWLHIQKGFKPLHFLHTPNNDKMKHDFRKCIY